MWWHIKNALLVFGLCSITLSSLWAEHAIPQLTGPVIDEAAILNGVQHNNLDEQIRSYLPKIQFQIWTLPSLEGEPIENLSMRAAEAWKLGTKKEGNGALITVALNERKMRIEVGQGIEGEITDIFSRRVIEDILKPRFREGRYYEGLQEALKILHSKVSGDADAKTFEEESTQRHSSPRRIPFLTIIFVIFWIFTLFFGRWGGRGYWGGGGGSWGGGSGGSWSGGGGGFSGGGSSGDW